MEPPGSKTAVRPVWYAGGDSARGELWTMLHLPYTSMVLGFVIVGAALAPSFSLVILSGTLLAYFLGLGLGAHFLDQIPGMGSRYVRHWSDRALWVGGFLSLGGAVAIGMVGVLWYVGPPLLLLVVPQTLCAVGYPLATWFGGAFHRDSVFALSWGSLPFLTSYYAQTQSLSGLSIIVATVFALVALAEIRLSRGSRRMRAASRSSGESDSPGAASSRLSFRRFDRALQALAAGTIVGALGLFAGRLVLGTW